jgi:hypothetical protein
MAVDLILAELETRHEELARSRAALERDLLELDRRRHITQRQTERVAEQAETRRAEAEADARRVRDEAEAAARAAIARASALAERILKEAAAERDRAWQELLGQHEQARAEHQETVVRLAGDIARLQATLLELQQQRSTLDERIAGLRAELGVLEATRRDAERIRELGPGAIDLLRFENDHIVAALREEALRLRSELDALGFERDRLQTNVGALARQLTTLEYRRADADTLRRAAEEAVEHFRDEATQRAEEILDEARKEAERLRARGEAEAESLRRDAEHEAVRRQAANQQAIAQLMGRAQEARAELARLEEQRAADATSLDRLRTELVDLERRRGVAAWHAQQEEARRDRVRAEAKAEAAEINAANDDAREAVTIACRQAEEILAETDAEVASMLAKARAERDRVVGAAQDDGARIVREAAAVLGTVVQRSLARVRAMSDHAQAWSELDRLGAELVNLTGALRDGHPIEAPPDPIEAPPDEPRIEAKPNRGWLRRR